MTAAPRLEFDPAPPGAVLVRHLPAAMLALARVRAAGSDGAPMLRVRVAPDARLDEATAPADLPDVAGSCRVLDGVIAFTPYFPFDAGVRYRASFALDGAALTLDFGLPAEADAAPTVLGIFPSAEVLPENLLRMYVLFSSPMQRGFAERAVRMLTGDGRCAPDVLYRAPLELWDGAMRCLTVLLDPGRLKRGVGPHRALGPPLREAQEYVLSIGAGMRGAGGLPLEAAGERRFRAGPALREAVAPDDWTLVAPAAGTRQALVLGFPHPLDWAMLHHALRVSLAGAEVAGSIEVGAGATSWRFTPRAPWTIDSYHVDVARVLEDCCGNDLHAAFDRPLRAMPGPQDDGDAVLRFTPQPFSTHWDIHDSHPPDPPPQDDTRRGDDRAGDA